MIAYLILKWWKTLASALHAAVNVACLVGIIMSGTTALAQGRKVIRLEAIKVEGRIQKPQAFYILQRSRLDLGSNSRLTRRFVKEIRKKLKQDPF